MHVETRTFRSRVVYLRYRVAPQPARSAPAEGASMPGLRIGHLYGRALTDVPRPHFWVLAGMRLLLIIIVVAAIVGFVFMFMRGRRGV